MNAHVHLVLAVDIYLVLDGSHIFFRVSQSRYFIFFCCDQPTQESMLHKKLKDPRIIDDAKKLINQLWQLPEHSKFLPCCNPTSLLRQDIPRLRQEPYFVGEKTDGVRVFLLMGFTDFSEEEYAICIDRTYSMYRVAVDVPPEYYNGTLLDGEYIASSNKYVVFDAVASRGYRYFMQPHTQRVQEVVKIVEHLHFLHPLLPHVVVKPWFHFDQPDQWRHLNRKGNCDGLIFSPENYALKAGQHPFLFKWKTEHTVDFVLSAHQRDADRSHPHLFFTDRGVPVDAADHGFSLVDENDSLTQEALRRIPCIVECVVIIVGNTMECRVVRLRTDKNTPNDLRTVRATVRNIQEALTFDTLLRVARNS